MDDLDAFEWRDLEHFCNPAAAGGAWDPARHGAVISAPAIAAAKAEIATWEGYRPTPLVELKGLAGALGVADLFYKDEGPRFGLGSFKALGGAYAVCRLLQRLLAADGPPPTSAELRSGRLSDRTGDITVATATDGNHGRSVAWGARQFGCRAVIYIHADVSDGREQALRALGAEVRRIDGNYDASVHQCASDAAANGWHVVSDTSYEGYLEVPRTVMEGYTVMAEEIAGALDDAPTHVVVQGGVGGLAAAICGAFWLRWGERRPRFVIAEPRLAPCLLESARNGKPSAVEIAEETLMAGLSCGEVSLLAWQVLGDGADDFLTLPESAVAPAMRLLARSPFGDPAITAGESAIAGLAVLLAAARSPEGRRALGLDEASRVLLLGTEGATDAEVYRRLVGA